MTPDFPETTWEIEDTIVVTATTKHFYVLGIYCGRGFPGWHKEVKWRGGITPEGLRWCKDNMVGRIVVGSVPREIPEDEDTRWPVLGFEKTVDAVKFKLSCL